VSDNNGVIILLLKRICRMNWPRIVTHEIYAVLLNSIALLSNKRLGEMSTNEECLAAQLLDPSPMTRAGAQVCLKNIKCNSAMMLKGKTSGRGTVIVNEPCNLQQSSARFN
jgi:hypothetical protein